VVENVDRDAHLSAEHSRETRVSHLDEFADGYSSVGLHSCIARLRFTNRIYLRSTDWNCKAAPLKNRGVFDRGNAISSSGVDQLKFCRFLKICQACWPEMSCTTVDSGTLEACGVKQPSEAGYSERNRVRRFSSWPGANSAPTEAEYICADQPADLKFRLQKCGGPYIYSATLAWFCSALGTVGVQSPSETNRISYAQQEAAPIWSGLFCLVTVLAAVGLCCSRPVRAVRDVMPQRHALFAVGFWSNIDRRGGKTGVCGAKRGVRCVAHG